MLSLFRKIFNVTKFEFISITIRLKIVSICVGLYVSDLFKKIRLTLHFHLNNRLLKDT